MKTYTSFNKASIKIMIVIWYMSTNCMLHIYSGVIADDKNCQIKKKFSTKFVTLFLVTLSDLHIYRILQSTYLNIKSIIFRLKVSFFYIYTTRCEGDEKMWLSTISKVLKIKDLLLYSKNFISHLAKLFPHLIQSYNYFVIECLFA